MEARPATVEDSCKHLFKARFPNVYKDNNNIVCYNFCQKCKDYFATVRAKKPNYIPFVVFFLQNWISFARNSISKSRIMKV